VSGHIGGDAFREAWCELQRVMLNDPASKIVEEIRLYRYGDRVELNLRLQVGWAKDDAHE
jgi:hypothetical protein